jgi:hypothetical protein
MQLFFNEGFGWTCRRCHEETKAREPDTDSRARFFHEGESGPPAARLSAPALARWRDASRRVLVCQTCGNEEAITHN